MLRAFLNLVFVIVWHHYRILIGKPAYKYLSDTIPMVATFIGTFLFAETVRYGIFSAEFMSADSALTAAYVIGLALLKNIVLVIFIAVLFESRDRSSSLTMVLLSSYTLVDVIVPTMTFLGVDKSLGFKLEMLFIFLFFGMSIRRFFQEPAEVRASGYRYSREQERSSVQDILPKL